FTASLSSKYFINYIKQLWIIVKRLILTQKRIT
ncbi:MAG: hypothetical protein ACI94Y_002885, partial [Maribacter sp.]